MGMAYTNKHKCVAFLAAAALLLPANQASAASGAEGAFQAAQAANAATQAASQAAGLSEIAKGQQNQQQGESTMNMQQVAMGAMQIASGLLGLLAAAAAGKKKDTSAGRDSGISSLGSGYNPSTHTASQGTGSNTSGAVTSNSLGESSVANNLNPIELHKEPLNTALSSIEKNFGIPRDKLVEALANGIAPKDIFSRAPKNAISADLANRIADGLAAGNANADATKNTSTSLNSASASLASVGGAGTGAPTGSSASGARMPASTAPENLEDLNSAANLALSPEIRSAMAKRAEQIRREKEMKEVHGWSIFQLVANRYRKLEPMLYGRVERTNPNPVPPQVRN